MKISILQSRHSLKQLSLLLIVIGLSFSFDCSAPLPANAVSVQVKKIADRGGRLDWYKGVKHNLVAFDAIYMMNARGGNIGKLVDSSKIWDEHGLFSPDRKFLAFISSRHDSSWQAPKSRAKNLQTELYIERFADGALRKVTNFNSGFRRYLASDFSWSKDGEAIMIQAAPFRKRLIGNDKALSPEIWLIEFVPEKR